ncbi:MAG: STT3 domain-containing protein [Candidatus Micrarchaeota archaeon]
MDVELLPGIIAFILSSLLFLIPGVLIARALLKGTKLGLFEQFIIGIVLGITLNPLLSALFNTFLGLKFSFFLVLFNALLLTVIGILLLYKQDYLRLPEISFTNPLGFLKKNHIHLILLVIMLFSFYPRIATSWNNDFFEFDPYFYAKISQDVLVNGQVEYYSDEVYYTVDQPELGVYDREIRPLVSYLTASFYSSFSFFEGRGFDKDGFILANGFYPPLVGALMAFFVFLLFKRDYSEYLGLIAAGFVAFTPQLITKMSAGVFELQPWGIFIAVALFALVYLAFRDKSYRLGLLAALFLAFNVLSSSNYIWGLMVIASFLLFKSFIDYLSGSVEKKDLIIVGMLAGSALLSDLVYIFYQRISLSEILPSISIGVELMVLTFVPFALFYFAQKKKLSKKLVVGGLVAVGALFLLLTPVGNMVLNYPSVLTGFAKTASPLSKTIQEEGASSLELFENAYGILNPPFLMLAITLILCFSAFFYLRKKHSKLAWAFLVLFIVFTFFNAQLDEVVSNVVSSDLASFFSSQDVFLYMGLSLLAALIILFSSEEKRFFLLLAVLIVFPVAFVGLSKLKYTFHLAAVLTIALGLLLGELFVLLKQLNEEVKMINEKTMHSYVLGLILFVGVFAVLLQGFGPATGSDLSRFDKAMTDLSYSHISPDWLDSMKWIRENTAPDSRFISWWDYGHWITFFGERKSVLDPGNVHPEFDQETAHALVDGDRAELVSVMKRHGANYILLDSDLIFKWGALVFLSGSCDSQIAPNCPAVKGIPNWEVGPGQSTYELTHYFEFLQNVGECPSSVSPVQLPLLKSTLGPTYCITNEDLLLLNQDGTLKAIPLKVIVLGDTISNETAYVTMFQNAILNVNPYLGELESKVIDAPFTRLFFFENLPGFSVEYVSPNGQVKIFKLNN